jgi:hypothetical protein
MLADLYGPRAGQQVFTGVSNGQAIQGPVMDDL